MTKKKKALVKENRELQIRSKERIAKYGEVFTAEREINSMLDLVKEESYRIDSKFLEPACGNGNFLIEILKRKLSTINRYDQHEFEVNTLIAIASMYGIEILEDNIIECRERLYNYLNAHYTSLFSFNCTDTFRYKVRFILSKNIIQGDTLALRDLGTGSDIVFIEWTVLADGELVQVEHTMRDLL